MQITEIPFVGRRAPSTAPNISQKIGLNWSPPFKLPVPVRINGKLVQYVNISEYGAIRFAAAKTGRYHYMPEDGKLPAGLLDFTGGYCVVPWGEPQRMSGCGLSVRMWNDGPIVIIEFVTKSTYRNIKYLYRVELSTETINIFYYQCQSAYDTYVGCVMEPSNVAGWPVKEDQQYHKKALKITTTTTDPEAPETPDPTFPPVVIDDSPIIEEPPFEAKTYRTVYEGGNYRVQELMR